jgi:hypothetical protein
MLKSFLKFKKILFKTMVANVLILTSQVSFATNDEDLFYIGVYHSDFCAQDNLSVDEAIERVYFANARGDFARFYDALERQTVNGLLSGMNQVGGVILYPMYVQRYVSRNNLYFRLWKAPTDRYANLSIPYGYTIKSLCYKKVDDACAVARYKAYMQDAIDETEYLNLKEMNEVPILSADLEFLGTKACR